MLTTSLAVLLAISTSTPFAQSSTGSGGAINQTQGAGSTGQVNNIAAVEPGVGPPPGQANPGIETPAPSSITNVPYLDLSVTLANRLYDHMLDSATNTYYYELSSNWQKVLSPTFSTLGNAFIVLGLLQLYRGTANETYLTWASSTSDSFWRNGWDQTHGGFYDTYSSAWKNSTCVQTTQPNALFEVDFLELASENGSAVWLQRANSIESVLNGRLWDISGGVPVQSYNICEGKPSGDVHIEVSIGSYLWATAEWQNYTSNSTFMADMASAASFAEKYLWDGNSNTLPGGPHSTDCGTTNGYLGFMRSVYANLSGLEDCRKGANENIWGAMGLAELYNITGGSTLLQFTNQDLSWINNTLWDPTNGGYHETTYRNDTLRSACSSTGDPRDYPGWTEGEQPMFWWQIGQLTANASERTWAGVAEQWTAAHQWNSTDGNGGDMTCLDSNTLPDEGQATLYDWVQGSALYSYSTITGPVVAPSTVVQPLEVDVSEAGAPQGAYTISGCSPSPTFGTTGSVFVVTMSASCSFEVSFTNAGGLRWGFIVSGTFSTVSAHSTCGSGTCQEVLLSADNQAQLTVNGGNGVTYSLKSETGDSWFKYGDILTVKSNGIWGRTSSTGTRLTSWNVDGGPNTFVATKGAVTTTPIAMTAAHLVNFVAVTQHPLTLAESPAGGGTSLTTTNPSIPGDTGWYDFGTVVSISATSNSGYAFSSWKGAGSGSYTGSENPASVTIGAALKETATFSSLKPRSSSTTISPNPANVVSGKTISFTAKVSDTGSGTKSPPTGTVSWGDGGAGGSFSGATCTLSSLTGTSRKCTVVYTSSSSLGSVIVTATYLGDATHSGSSGTASLSVLRGSSTKVTPSKTSETLGILLPVIFTATVADTSTGAASTPTGTVTWSDGGKGGTFSNTTCTLTASGSGSSVCTVTYTPSPSAAVGTIMISASYSGDSSHIKSAGSALIVIN